MNRIRLLPEQVANQIAAGEVIERPASVLKELVENSLDAGATQIDVEIGAGGRSLIAVRDNGSGMSKDDALLCLERHATSKLRNSDDLDSILSYGFRGEAIPSIASVSKFRLCTREAESLAGTEIVIEGGKIRDVREAGLVPGTQIEVRSLFYNLPARRKFMRTAATEAAHLRQTLLFSGLARPEVGFTLQMDGGEPQRWLPGESLAQRLVTIFGPEWVAQTVPLEAESDGFRLHGFIGKPGMSRAGRHEELFFINRRPVENRTLHFGLLEGYHNSLMKGRYPIAVLFLALDPAEVDVNIHPAKREVRFHNDPALRHFIVQAVQQTLRQFTGAPPARLTWGPAPEEPGIAPTPAPPEDGVVASEFKTEGGAAPLVEPVSDKNGINAKPAAPWSYSPDFRLQREAEPAALQPSLPLAIAPVAATPDRPAALWSNRLDLRIIGCVAQLYLIAENREGLVLIDQHAAHERVLFEQMWRRMEQQELAAQQLLFPVTLTFLPREADFLFAQIETLQRAGVGITHFGAVSFLVDALPVMIKPRDVGEFIRTLVTDLQQAGGESRKGRRLSEEVVAKTVCRRAVKANDALHPAEWDRLLVDLLACDLPYTCPHGRPTMIQLSLAELEKKFGRAG